MLEVKEYHLRPTRLIPNSPQPLLHYRGVFDDTGDLTPPNVHNRFTANDWRTQWIFRYGDTQGSHYHSRIHECMVVLSGQATIRFGVADTSDDLEESTYGSAKEEGAIELQAQAGDVFVIPAGVAHKTFNTTPSEAFALLTPGEGRGIQATDVSEALANVKLSGFTMMGAYPKNCGTWDFSRGGEDIGNFEVSWNVPKPERDPVLGSSAVGLCGRWRDIPLPQRKNPYARL